MAVHPKDEHDRPLLLLGEQRESPVLRAVLDRWGIVGPVGLAAPGWEEDEVDDGWVREAVGRPLANSQLYTLADQLFVEDPEVIALLRERQDELRRLRDLNKIQLDHLLTVARELMRREWQGQHVGPQLDLTLEHIRQVDQVYFHQVREVIRSYDKRIDPWERPSVQRYRLRVVERLQNCQCLLIAGGHVGVLLNRLNLSRLLRYLDVPVIAWSGGALAMGEKVVFYHQSLP
ncbi:MAG TPA: hypothetical protein PKD54_03385, partial [Pirellulaceae bacterium]|nr:hypothetical protein [Pirellulaceae bacterium]